jgi:hypothetical protein
LFLGFPELQYQRKIEDIVRRFSYKNTQFEDNIEDLLDEAVKYFFCNNIDIGKSPFDEIVVYVENT